MTATLQYTGSRVDGITYTLPNGGTFASSFTRSASRPNLVTRRDYRFGAGSICWYETGYDLAGRPTNAVDSISIARTYLYNRRSELAEALVGTNSFSYAYDTIGNRIWSSANFYTNSYTANCLNQYSSISILRDSVPPCEPVYDADGNLIQDDRFAYAYDAENRLISVVPRIPVEGSFSVENRYNHKNLRVRKIVRRYTDGEWTDYAAHEFTYDGVNVDLERIGPLRGLRTNFDNTVYLLMNRNFEVSHWGVCVSKRKNSLLRNIIYRLVSASHKTKAKQMHPKCPFRTPPALRAAIGTNFISFCPCAQITRVLNYPRFHLGGSNHTNMKSRFRNPARMRGFFFLRKADK